MNRRRKADTGETARPLSTAGEPPREVPDWHAGDGLLRWRGQSKHVSAGQRSRDMRVSPLLVSEKP
jgi:hypothetical protein